MLGILSTHFTQSTLKLHVLNYIKYTCLSLHAPGLLYICVCEFVFVKFVLYLINDTVGVVKLIWYHLSSGNTSLCSEHNGNLLFFYD